MSNRRSTLPQNSPQALSKHTVNSLSEVRRAQILDAVNKDLDSETASKYPAAVVHSADFSKGLVKKGMVGPFAAPTTTSKVDQLAPDVYSPLFQLANLNLPRDRITMNAWNRVFYDTHPLVRNAVNLHASFPISKINITCKSKKVQQFFLEMSEKLDLYSVVYGAALEFWKHGECFPYAELDRQTGTWKRITVLNPDYVHVKKTIIGDQSIVSLRPDANLIKIVSSNNPADIAMKKMLPQHIIDCVRKGQNIPLDNLNISHLKLLSSPYDVRGTSILVSVYKDLMLYDKLRESKFAQADGMINPMTLVKLGGAGEYRPTQADIDAFRGVLEEAQYDKDFKLVTHDGVTIERVGFSGATMEIAGDVEKIMENIYIGLMLPKSLIEQEGASYASSSIGLEVLRQRYDVFRNMIKKWLERKIFAPICELQDFYEYRDGERILEVPTIDFNHMNLYDMNDYVSTIAPFVNNKQVSLQTLYRSLGLSFEEENRRLKEEAIQFAIFEKQQAVLKGMRLSELENLDVDKGIQEPVDEDSISIPGVGSGGGQLETPEMPSLPEPTLPGGMPEGMPEA